MAPVFQKRKREVLIGLLSLWGTLAWGNPPPATPALPFSLDGKTISRFLQALPPEQAAQFSETAGRILAQGITLAKEEALRQGTEPLPPTIFRQLTPYFPREVLETVRWSTVQPKSVHQMLAQWLHIEGAITYDTVVIFAHERVGRENVLLWAHELTHVMQYQRMGIEAFAQAYVTQSDLLEAEAKAMEDAVRHSLGEYSRPF